MIMNNDKKKEKKVHVENTQEMHAMYSCWQHSINKSVFDYM